MTAEYCFYSSRSLSYSPNLIQPCPRLCLALSLAFTFSFVIRLALTINFAISTPLNMSQETSDLLYCTTWACTYCRCDKSQCDQDRPCGSCREKGLAQTCSDGCEMCRKEKLLWVSDFWLDLPLYSVHTHPHVHSCDANRPCLPCQKGGTECLPLSHSLPVLPHRIRKCKPVAPLYSPAIHPRPPSLPLPTPYLPPDKVCNACKDANVICNSELPCSRCVDSGTRCIFPAVAGLTLRCTHCRERNRKCERARPCQLCLILKIQCTDKKRKGKGRGLRVKRACDGCRVDKVQCEPG
jgi:hypothetical protein